MFPADQIDAIAGLVEDSKSSHLGLDSRAPRIGPRTNTAATLKELVLGKQPLDDRVVANSTTPTGLCADQMEDGGGTS